MFTAVAAATLADARTGHAFANQTHQQVTEVAFAYLKAVSSCATKSSAKPSSSKTIPQDAIDKYHQGIIKCELSTWSEWPPPHKWENGADSCSKCLSWGYNNVYYDKCAAGADKYATPSAQAPSQSAEDVYSVRQFCAKNDVGSACVQDAPYTGPIYDDLNHCIHEYCRKATTHNCKDEACIQRCYQNDAGWKDSCLSLRFCRMPSIVYYPSEGSGIPPRLVVMDPFVTTADATTPGSRPYWASITSDPTFMRELCDSLIWKANNTVRDEKCENFGAGFVNGVLTVQQATDAVNYLHEMMDTPCPGSEWRTHDGSLKRCANDPNNIDNVSMKALRNHTVGMRTNSKTTAESLMAGGVGAILDAELPIPDKNNPSKYLDLTGSLLGYRSGITDSLDDVFAQVVYGAWLEDLVKKAADGILGAIGSGAATGALILGAMYCGGSCVLSLFSDCGGCFSSDWDFAEGVYGQFYDWDQALHDKRWLGAGDPQSVLNGVEISPLHHFLRDSSRYDDKDGIDFNQSEPPAGIDWPGWGIDVVQTGAEYGLPILASAVLGPIGLLASVDVRVSWEDSNRTLNNYQIKNSTDGLPPTAHDNLGWMRDAAYWDNTSLTDDIFAPADNMAYYWWHKWLYGRSKAEPSCPTKQALGLFPLGIAIHAVQDMATKHHADGMLGHSHHDYESWISSKFDIYSKDGGLTLNIPQEDEWAFLHRVSKYLRILDAAAVNPVTKVLKIRDLAHEVRRINLDYFNNKKDNQWGSTYQLAHAREVVIPLAVAATVLMIREGAAKPYHAYPEMISSIDKFQNVGPVPPLDGESDGPGPELPPSPVCTHGSTATSNAVFSGASGSPGVIAAAPTAPTEPGASLASVPGLGFAAAQPRVQAIAQQYLDGQATGEDLLHVAFEESARGYAVADGRTEPDAATMSAIADAEVARLKANLAFYQNRSIPLFRQAMACARLKNPPSVLRDADRSSLQSVCDGTQDSDGDGVSDLIDECFTPPDLIAAGATVQANGCIFQHQSKLQTKYNGIIPGKMLVRQ